MENEPEIIQEEGKIHLRFRKSPTQAEFDYWANVVNAAIEYANKRTGKNVKIIGWEHEES